MNGARMLGTVIALVALLAGAAPTAAAAPRAPVAAPNLSPVWWTYYDDCNFQLIDVGVTNAGDADAGPFAVGARIDGRPYGVARYNKILEPGRTVGVGSWSKIRLQPAVHHVEFLLDPGWQIQESHETDNHREFDVTCK